MNPMVSMVCKFGIFSAYFQPSAATEQFSRLLTGQALHTHPALPPSEKLTGAR